MRVSQTIMYRESKMVDEGTMGFSDWTKQRETLEDFVKRVTDEMQKFDSTSVSYPNDDTAIIQYWTK